MNEEKNRDIQKSKKAYKEILSVLEKYKDAETIINLDHIEIEDGIEKIKECLRLLEWEEKYGIKIDGSFCFGRDFCGINEHLFISYFGDAQKDKNMGFGRYISWSDDGNQPKNEWLFSIEFDTGAYIFGDNYGKQKPLFDEFFNELKNYSPDYSDSTNHHLYWNIKNAGKIFNDFQGILNKYQERNKAEALTRKIKELEAKLGELIEESSVVPIDIPIKLTQKRTK